LAKPVTPPKNQTLELNTTTIDKAENNSSMFKIGIPCDIKVDTLSDHTAPKPSAFGKVDLSAQVVHRKDMTIEQPCLPIEVEQKKRPLTSKVLRGFNVTRRNEDTGTFSSHPYSMARK
jgi:hypothetical protein